MLAWVVALYYPGLSGEFLLDDLNEIVNNPAIHLDRLTLSGVVEAGSAFVFGFWGRPLPMMTLAIDHSFWGLNPFGYKLTNVVVHVVNAGLLAWLALRLLQIDQGDSRRGALRALALFLILVWAIHPVQVSTVLYAVQRMEMMAATFIVLGVTFYLMGRQRQMNGRGKGWWLLSLSATCMVLALLCKETGLLLPGYAFILELVFFRFRAKTRRDALAMRWLWGTLVAAATFLFVAYFLPKHTNDMGYLARDFTWQERVLTQLRILPMYLGQILWPDPQNYPFYYDSVTPSKSLLEPPTTLLGGLLLLGLLTAAFALRRRAPLFSLGILWFFVSHALTSNVVPLELAFEHRNYIALFGILLALAGLLRLVPWQPSKSLLGAGALVIIAFVSFLTLINTATWGNPLELAMAFQHRNPNSERAQYMLAEKYRQMSDQNPNSPFFEMAESAFSKASRLPDSSPLPEHALIAMHAYADQQVEPEWWSRLIDKVESGPRGPMQIRAVRTLLEIHNNGHPIDPERLMEAGIALLNKPGLNPSVNYEFALLALEALEDESLARAILNAGAARSGDPEWPGIAREALIREGHAEFARQWSQTRSE